MKRKHPKTTGYYCYCHITPDEMFYIGMTKEQPCDRWNPSQYKTHSLRPYIDKYGWDNIRHVVLKDGLTKEQAEQLEDLLIQEATRQGFCINKKGSGGKARDNKKEWQREWQQRPEVKERRREWHCEYRQRPEVKEYQREYNQRPEVKEHKHQWYLKKKALKN